MKSALEQHQTIISTTTTTNSGGGNRNVVNFSSRGGGPTTSKTAITTTNSRNQTTTTTTVSKSLPPQQQEQQRKQQPPIICLTGFAKDEKDLHHSWIEQLGGIYTRNLDTAQNTHLVAKEAHGPKYDAAQTALLSSDHSSQRSSNNNYNSKSNNRCGGIQIVKPTWLEECYQCQAWIPVRPSDHCFFPTTRNERGSSDHGTEECDDKNKSFFMLTEKKSAAEKENNHNHKDNANDNDKGVIVQTLDDTDSDPPVPQAKSVVEQLETALQEWNSESLAAPQPSSDQDCFHYQIQQQQKLTLFLPCHFILVGFAAYDNETNDGDKGGGDGDAFQKAGQEKLSDQPKNKKNTGAIQRLLCPLIRCGLGRIAWTFNYQITHVVLPDDCCNLSVRDAAKLMQSEHPNAPVIVSPRWILACWQAKELVETAGFEPRYVMEGPVQPPKRTTTTSSSSNQPKNPKRKRPANNSLLFRHCLFTLLRVAPPPGAMDYPTSELETMIYKNGGQILTSQIVHALLVDEVASSKNRNNNSSSNNNNNIRPPHKKTTTAATKTLTSAKRKAYVVCWGGNVESNLTMHATLGQVRHLCDWTFVSPIWLQTCVAEGKLVSSTSSSSSSSLYPSCLFQPQPWPLQRLDRYFESNDKNAAAGAGNKRTKHGDKNNNNNDDDCKKIHIAITGFKPGSLRTALTLLIHDMGAIYDESIVRDQTTHLIVATTTATTTGPQPPSSAKYEKALEWKLHIVTLDWLFHVAQYGYHGKQIGKPVEERHESNSHKAKGCEAKFPVLTGSPRKQRRIVLSTTINGDPK